MRAIISARLAAVVVSIIIGLSVISCQKAKDSPKSAVNLPAFEPAVFDYGSVLQNQTVEHIFRLANHSTNDLLVEEVQTSCSCTTAKLGDSQQVVIPAGGEIGVPVTFETGYREGPYASTVTVSLLDRKLGSDRTRYVLRAQMRGEIIPDFTVEPSGGLDFGTMRPGQKLVQTVTFWPGLTKDLSLLAVEIKGSPSFKVLDDGRGRGNLTSNLVLSLTAEAPTDSGRQMLSGVLEVETSSKRYSKVQIFLSAKVVPEEFAEPDLLVLPVGGGLGKSRIRIVTVNPSCVTRTLLITSDHARTNDIKQILGNTSDWSLYHDIYISNAAIWSGSLLKFELVVQNRTGQAQTRTVSVKIASL